MRRVAIKEFLAESKHALVLDVRSPGEYQHAHIPGAVSLPLFTNEERAVVGTQYKQVSRQAAIKVGLDYFGPKMRKMVEEVERLMEQRNRRTEEQGIEEGRKYRTDEQKISHAEVNEKGSTTIAHQTDFEQPTPSSKPLTPNPQVFLYCWRGGMRSGAVAWLLNLYGFDVTVLAGGYKAFRNWVLETIADPYPLRLVGGYTGSGKTAILKALEQGGEYVVNLEALANHKGSAFGNIGMPLQPSQEMFENLLSLQLKKIHDKQENSLLTTHHSPFRIWVEDESQRIGQINLPQAFWLNMRRSPVYFLDIPFEERLQNLVQEYGILDKERMIAAIQRITKRLGGLEANNAIQFLEEGNTAECFRILLRYYDKHYLKGLHNRDSLDAVLTNIPCESVTEKNAALLSQLQPVL